MRCQFGWLITSKKHPEAAFGPLAGPRLVRRFADPPTISLGTGLSCFPYHSICSSEAICLVRECPLQTVSDRAVGHGTGTPALTIGRW